MKKTPAILTSLLLAQAAAFGQGAPVKFHDYSSGQSSSSGLGIQMNGVSKPKPSPETPVADTVPPVISPTPAAAPVPASVPVTSVPAASAPAVSTTASTSSPTRAIASAAQSLMTVTGSQLVDLKHSNPVLQGTYEDVGKTVTTSGQNYVVKQLKFDGGYPNSYILEAVGRSSSTTTPVASSAIPSSGKSLYSTPAAKQASPPSSASGSSSGGLLTVSGTGLLELKRSNPALQGTYQDVGKRVATNGHNYVVKQVRLDGAYVASYMLGEDGAKPSTTPTTTISSATSTPRIASSGGVYESVFGGSRTTSAAASTPAPYIPVSTPVASTSVASEPSKSFSSSSPSSSSTDSSDDSAKSLDKPVRAPIPKEAIARGAASFLRAAFGRNATVGALVNGLQAAAAPQSYPNPGYAQPNPGYAQPNPAPQQQGAPAPVTTGIDSAAQRAPVPSNVINTPVRDKWAVIVGIGKFQDPTIPKLKYPAKDAKDFYDYLVTTGHFAPDHVRFLLNEDGTRERIMTEVGDFLPRVVKPDDLVVFYFSSHGSPASRDVGNKNFLIAHDTKKDKLFAGGIDVQFIMELMSSRIKANRLLIVLDACHSAGAVGAKGDENGANFNPEQFRLGTGHMLLCSSAADERSWESKRYPNGIFTHYLIQGLSSKGPSTKIGDAFKFLQKNVSDEVQQDESGVTQTPRLKTDLWKGNDLILQVQPAHPEPLPEAVRKSLEPDSKGKPF